MKNNSKPLESHSEKIIRIRTQAKNEPHSRRRLADEAVIESRCLIKVNCLTESMEFRVLAMEIRKMNLPYIPPIRGW